MHSYSGIAAVRARRDSSCDWEFVSPVAVKFRDVVCGTGEICLEIRDLPRIRALPEPVVVVVIVFVD